MRIKEYYNIFASAKFFSSLLTFFVLEIPNCTITLTYSIRHCVIVYVRKSQNWKFFQTYLGVYQVFSHAHEELVLFSKELRANSAHSKYRCLFSVAYKIYTRVMFSGLMIYMLHVTLHNRSRLMHTLRNEFRTRMFKKPHNVPPPAKALLGLLGNISGFITI